MSDQLGERLALSPAEAAAALGVSRDHVYDLMSEGVLPSFHLGRSRRIPRTAIEALLADAS